MSLEETPVPEAQAVVTRGPSELLSEARQRLGLSQKEVADKLFLTTTFIKYIDEGDYTRIRKPAFVKGYLRSYARVVELSGDEIVALYEAELQAAEPEPEIRGVTEEKVGTASITGPVLQTGLIGLGALVLVVAVIWWMVSDSDDDPIVVTQSTATQPAASQPTGSRVSDANIMHSEAETADFQFDQQQEDRIAAGQTDQPESTGTEADESASSLVAEPAPVAGRTNRSTSTEGVTIERTTDGARSFISVDASGFDQLELSFKDECWVEINDTQYGLVYNDLNRANEVLTIYGTAPFRVLLGKATGVEMIYNGRPFKLEPFISGDRTAKVTVSD